MFTETGGLNPVQNWFGFPDIFTPDPTNFHYSPAGSRLLARTAYAAIIASEQPVFDIEGIDGAVFDTTPLASIGGLSSSVIGVSRESAQAEGHYAGREDDRLSSPAFIHRIGNGPDLPLEDQIQSVNLKGKSMLYIVAAADVAFDAEFGSTGYRNATNPPVTVFAGEGCWAVAI
jgi:hypothetical protein